jgi:hypothetical protein
MEGGRSYENFRRDRYIRHFRPGAGLRPGMTDISKEHVFAPAQKGPSGCLYAGISAEPGVRARRRESDRGSRSSSPRSVRLRGPR